MGAHVPYLQVVMLVLYAVHASPMPPFEMDNYVDGPSYMSDTDKLVKAMDYKLELVKEEYQVLKNELNRTTKLVEELKKEVLGLKSVVMEDEDQREEPEPDYVTSAEPNLEAYAKEMVEEYVAYTDWNALRKGLEKLLAEDSVEYQQLQTINDHSWGHLWQVGSDGYEELATLLLDAGLPPNKIDNVGDTILHGAAEGGRIHVAKLLLDRGAGVNWRGWRGLTPFNKAALGNQPQMVKWLADHGADINSADDNGMTSLHFAAEHGHLAVVRLLVDMGLDVNAKDASGWTPLDWAKRNRHIAVANFLSSIVSSNTSTMRVIHND